MSDVKVITDAQLVQQFAEKIAQEPAPEIVTQAPQSNFVELPGGVIKNGELVTTVEIRELNGADEEAISRAGSVSKALQVALRRGIVKIGEYPVTTEDLDQMLSGDRDTILLAIRRLTFGSLLKGIRFACDCGSRFEADVDLENDVEIRKLEDPINDRVWTVNTKQGVLKLALPNGTVQKKVSEDDGKTSAELSTMLIAGCIVSLNNSPVISSQVALELGIADREAVITSLLERNPGPRLLEVTKTCEACGRGIPFPLGLADLFRV